MEQRRQKRYLTAVFGAEYLDYRRRVFHYLGRRTGEKKQKMVDRQHTATGLESISKKEILMYNLLGRRISRFFMGRIAEKLGCKAKLDAKPYESSLNHPG